jgi:lactate dehydrogenase-like 2-hydroxyacid dehydrogenase
MSTIIVTEKEYRKAEAVFTEVEGFQCIAAGNSEEAVAEAVRAHGARHVIVGVEPYSGPLYEALPAGGVIARFGGGHDGIDKIRAAKAGLLCTNTPGVLTDSVAELTMAMLLMAARGVVKLANVCKAEEWPVALGQELAGKTLAVIGCGAIGRRAAQIAAFGFRMRVVGCEKHLADEAQFKKTYGFNALSADFGETVRGADYVSLHLPGGAETYHFINADRLRLLGKQAWLINTSRGSVVDEKALYAALAGRALGGAVLDVFEREPYNPVSSECDLRRLENVIMLPHHGSSTREAAERMAQRCLTNIRNAEAGGYGKMDLLNPIIVEKLH